MLYCDVRKPDHLNQQPSHFFHFKRLLSVTQVTQNAGERFCIDLCCFLLDECVLNSSIRLQLKGVQSFLKMFGKIAYNDFTVWNAINLHNAIFFAVKCRLLFAKIPGQIFVAERHADHWKTFLTHDLLFWALVFSVWHIPAMEERGQILRHLSCKFKTFQNLYRTF